ncbi:MAG TPA: hypothetical protein VEW28_03495 [Candidatus Kapabacteria bacterium]|nr:hypothetical protein [Candidatus Kapabacteria bacterium]
MNTDKIYSNAEQNEIESLAKAYVLGDLVEGDQEYIRFESLLDARDPVLMKSLESLFERSVALGAAVQYGSTGETAPNPLQQKLRSKNRLLVIISVVAGLLICLLLALNVMNSAKLDRSKDLMKALLTKYDSLSRAGQNLPLK